MVLLLEVLGEMNAHDLPSDMGRGGEMSLAGFTTGTGHT